MMKIKGITYAKISNPSIIEILGNMPEVQMKNVTTMVMALDKIIDLLGADSQKFLSSRKRKTLYCDSITSKKNTKVCISFIPKWKMYSPNRINTIISIKFAVPTKLEIVKIFLKFHFAGLFSGKTLSVAILMVTKSFAKTKNAISSGVIKIPLKNK